jgi:hypothetical protein
MKVEVRANKEKQVVEIVNQEGNVVLVLDREACMFLPALVRVKAMEVWNPSFRRNF